jgi:hypothetical protein
VREPYPQQELGRACVQAFLAFLEKRRTLYAPGDLLNEDDTRISAQKIVHECALCLDRLDGSPGAMLVQVIANACRSFVEQSFSSSAEFYITVGALRLIVADAIAKLSVAYSVSAALPAISLISGENACRAGHGNGHL